MWFYGIYLIIKRQVFKSLNSWTWPSAGRPLQKSVDRSGRSTCTDVHASLSWWAGRPSREFCSLEMAPVDRPVYRQRALFSVSSSGRPTESRCSRFPDPIDRAVDRWLNGHKNDRWPVDRKGNYALSCCQRADSVLGYKYPSFELL